MISKIVGWGLVIFAAYYLFTDPTGAAHFVSQVFSGLKSAGNSLSQFANHA